MTNTVDSIVLGAGMVGVSTALQLQSHGHSVALVDRQPAGEGTSYGNAGLIQAEGIVPYMLPLNATRLLASLLNRTDDVHIHYRQLPALTTWLARYGLNSFDKAVARISDANVPLIAKCVSEHDAFMKDAKCEDLARRTGYLKIFRDTEDLEAEETACKLFHARYGINYAVLNPDELAEMEPNLSDDLVGAIHFPDPVSVSNPSKLTKAYADLFRARGGQFMTADATTLSEQSRGGWQVQTVDGALKADHAVLALGPWSADLLARFGVRLPLAVKRGYHMHYSAKGNASLGRPVIDVDHGYVLTQMDGGIRMTTGAEFAARDAQPTPRQVDRVEPHARALFPLDDRAEAKPWVGARPCFPDMLPVIGAIPGKPGLWANFGHHHLGLTLGPVSGRLLAELMTGAEPFTDPMPYAATRFS